MSQLRGPGKVCLAAILLGIATISGCALWNRDAETVLKVEVTQNTAKAAKLTRHGIKQLNRGEIERAGASFRQAVAADPEYGPAHSNLGLTHFEHGDLFSAVLSFERALELMPYDPNAAYNLALALESAGKVYEAMDLYYEAVEVDPTNPVYLGNLCRLRVRLGDHDPHLIQQLQDLALIETRPRWRRWADRELALHHNPMLDRGPETPEYNPDLSGDDDDKARSSNQIIELNNGLQGPSNSDPDSVEFRLEDPDNANVFNSRVWSQPTGAREDNIGSPTGPTLPPIGVLEQETTGSTLPIPIE